MNYDYLIIGCGLFGSVFAQQAKEHGKSVKIIERRAHIGGNCHSYDFEDTGISVHTYGTHVFHCSDLSTWEYVNRFSTFNHYRHRVLSKLHDRVFSIPINLGTVNSFFGVNLLPREMERFLSPHRVLTEVPSNLEEEAIASIGRPLYEAFIRGYTRKQWGCDPKELPKSIIRRLPVRTSYSDAYFNDPYQGIPIGGYTELFERMLEGIPIELNVDFFLDREYWERMARKVVYTGPIDRFFDYRYGPLSWRSVRFEVERIEISDYQGTSVMNYADESIPFTRIHEPKHLHLEKEWNKHSTVVIKEFPCVDTANPCYPMNRDSDQERFLRYAALQSQLTNVIFGGRLARYKYYDMNQVIAGALVAARKELNA